MITLHEGTLNTPGLPRFHAPGDETVTYCHQFDSDDIISLVKGLGADKQELADLDVMLRSVIDNVRRNERYAAAVQQIAAVSQALKMVAK